MRRARPLHATALSAFVLLPAAAHGAVSVSAGATLVTVTGTAGSDTTVLTDEAADVRISNATAGAGCTQNGTAALCPRGTRTISADLGLGDDDLDNRSLAEATVAAGGGADLLIGRLRSVDAGPGLDVLRPSGMTGTVSLVGGADFDVYDIGADTGASDVIADDPGYLVDYLSRPAADGGVTVTADDLADDGAHGEFDKVGGATHVRGTVGADDITGSAGGADVLDGDLGADRIDAGDDLPNPSSGSAFLAGDALVFGMDAAMPYARPAPAARTEGVSADLAAGTSSDGDSVTRMDDLRGTPFDDVLTGAADGDLIEAGGGTGNDQVVAAAGRDTITCDHFVNPILGALAPVAVAHGAATLTFVNQCTLSVDGGSGADTIEGGAFGDTLRGGPEDDDLDGGPGDDVIVGGPGTDALRGDDGIDTVSFAEDPAGVTVDLGSAAGQEISGGSFENAVGSRFDDTITGTAGRNVLDGGPGTDTLSYAGRAEPLRILLDAGTVSASGVHEDVVGGFERVEAGEGNDFITGTPGPDVLAGGGGDDTVVGGFGADTVSGGPGGDTIDFRYLEAPASGDSKGIRHVLGGAAVANSEGDASKDVERLAGSKLDDVLVGTDGDDVLTGRGGDDRIHPRAGSDVVTGSGGADTLSYVGAAGAIRAVLDPAIKNPPINAPLTVDEHAPPGSGGTSSARVSTDTMTDEFENLVGTSLGDSLVGGPKANVIRGGGGDDAIDGGEGDDLLHGDGGDDRFGRVSPRTRAWLSSGDIPLTDGDADGSDRVFAGAGDDEVNVRDAQLDGLLDCGTGPADAARQDLVDDEGDLRVDGCESLETAPVGQVMAAVVDARRRGRKVAVRLRCPRRSSGACRGTAGLVGKRGATPRRVTRYRIRPGRGARLGLRGRGRFVVLAERDRDGRPRRLVRPVARRVR